MASGNPWCFANVVSDDADPLGLWAALWEESPKIETEWLWRRQQYGGQMPRDQLHVTVLRNMTASDHLPRLQAMCEQQAPIKCQVKKVFLDLFVRADDFYIEFDGFDFSTLTDRMRADVTSKCRILCASTFGDLMEQVESMNIDLAHSSPHSASRAIVWVTVRKKKSEDIGIETHMPKAANILAELMTVQDISQCKVSEEVSATEPKKADIYCIGVSLLCPELRIFKDGWLDVETLDPEKREVFDNYPKSDGHISLAYVMASSAERAKAVVDKLEKHLENRSMMVRSIVYDDQKGSKQTLAFGQPEK